MDAGEGEALDEAEADEGRIRRRGSLGTLGGGN